MIQNNLKNIRQCVNSIQKHKSKYICLPQNIRYSIHVLYCCIRMDNRLNQKDSSLFKVNFFMIYQIQKKNVPLKCE